MSELVARAAEPILPDLTGALRVVVVNGPRQSGKTTLLRQYQARHGGSYRTLDDPQMLAAARDDPVTFARSGDMPRLIDEVQRGGDELVRAIKMVVDLDTGPGQFVLSGSSRFLTIPTLSESLAGRAVFLDLWPLSLAEMTGGRLDFCARAFDDPAGLAATGSSWSRERYLDAVTAGGYPEVQQLHSGLARGAWYRGYLSTVIDRDIREIAQVHQARALPDLLGLVAARAGSTTSIADLARSVDLDRATTKNYLSWLDLVFLTTTVPAWSTNLSARISKAPKLYPSDSGIASHLLQADAAELREPGHPALGAVLETFVATELLKLCSFVEPRVSVRHYRDHQGREVDFVLEGAGGRVVAIETRATVSPGSSAVRPMRWLKDKLGDRFVAGFLLHLGQHATSLGDNIFALPLSVLWGHRADDLPDR